MAFSKRRRVVVIGGCASGKSTLVAALREVGIDAYACAQEHSEIATLFRHLEPDYVVALDADLETVRQRRGGNWPADLYAEQLRRLALARASADIQLDTGRTSVTASVARVLSGLERSDD